MPTRTSASSETQDDPDSLVPKAKWGDHLPHGFKAKAKRIAGEVRKTHRIGPREPFDPVAVTAELGHQVVRLSDLEGLSPESLHQLTICDPSAFSGLVVRAPGQAVIIVNGTHSAERQRSTGTHELGHLILNHPASPPFVSSGCRAHDARVEAEADYLASVLLVPPDTVMAFARQELSIEAAALAMGVSREMMQWRFNAEGAVKRVARERSRGR